MNPTQGLQRACSRKRLAVRHPETQNHCLVFNCLNPDMRHMKGVRISIPFSHFASKRSTVFSAWPSSPRRSLTSNGVTDDSGCEDMIATKLSGFKKRVRHQRHHFTPLLVTINTPSVIKDAEAEETGETVGPVENLFRLAQPSRRHKCS
ncbi:hypothetical protein AAHC03_020872 [Spirometra sp. Aus1]